MTRPAASRNGWREQVNRRARVLEAEGRIAPAVLALRVCEGSGEMTLLLRYLWHVFMRHGLKDTSTWSLDGSSESYECSCGGAIMVRDRNAVLFRVYRGGCPVFERWLVRRREESKAALPRARSLSKADRERLVG